MPYDSELNALPLSYQKKKKKLVFFFRKRFSREVVVRVQQNIAHRTIEVHVTGTGEANDFVSCVYFGMCLSFFFQDSFLNSNLLLFVADQRPTIFLDIIILLCECNLTL